MLTVVAVIGAIAIRHSIPISSDAVKKSISDQITNWTGRTFTFTGDAELRLFPYQPSASRMRASPTRPG